MLQVHQFKKGDNCFVYSLRWESRIFFPAAMILLPRILPHKLLYTGFIDVTVSMEMLQRYLNNGELEDVGWIYARTIFLSHRQGPTATSKAEA